MNVGFTFNDLVFLNHKHRNKSNKKKRINKLRKTVKKNHKKRKKLSKDQIFKKEFKKLKKRK